MWSRTWCFNKTLLRKNLTRFWPLWVMASFLAALPPIMMAVELMRYRGTTSMNALYITEGYYSVLTYLIPPVLLVYAVVCAMAVWSYLFNSRSVGLMHTLPISRKGLFVTNFLSGFLMVLIPFVVCGALCVVVTAAFGLLDPVGLAVTVLCSLGLALFYFASATVCAFLTGNAFAMPAFYFVFHFLAVTLEMLLSNLANLCLFGVSGAYTGVVEWLSPTYWLNEHLHVERTWEEVTRALPHGDGQRPHQCEAGECLGHRSLCPGRRGAAPVCVAPLPPPRQRVRRRRGGGQVDEALLPLRRGCPGSSGRRPGALFPLLV